MIKEEDINNIRNNANIVDIMSSYLNLEKKGKNYFGLCPFHDDNNPSMSVSEEKQIYTCFVCGASGNVFTFLQDYENISFPEAVKKVANTIGYSLNVNIKTNYKNKELYEINELANLYFQNNLKSKEGAESRKYLLDRKITDELIDFFEIGTSFNNNNLTNLLISKKYKENDLIKVGVSGKKDNLYDFFRNRIIFPIKDEKGKTVGFSGRTYSDDDIKYINTKENEIFTKGKILYNYSNARLSSVKKKKIYIVEGFMDVIKMKYAGIDNVVATMGTAITKDHLNMLKRLNINVSLLFDNDEAGIKTTISTGNLFLENDIKTNVIVMDKHKDPDDYISIEGKEAFHHILQNETSFFEFKTNYFKNKINLNNPDEVSEYINNVIKSLNIKNDDILTNLTINKLSKEFNLDKNLLLSKITKKEKKKKNDINPLIAKKRLSRYEKLSEHIIYLMIKNNEHIKQYEEDAGFIPIKRYNEIANDILAYSKTNINFDIADFITYMSTSKNYREFLDIIHRFEKDKIVFEEFEYYLESLDKWITQSQIDELIIKLNKEVSNVKKEEINDKIIKLKKESEIYENN